MKKEKTPIKDINTGLPIYLGDTCKNEKGYVGIVFWDDYLNQYLLKSNSGGNLYSRTYTKVNKNTIGKNPDTARVECRRNPNKKQW